MTSTRWRVRAGAAAVVVVVGGLAIAIHGAKAGPTPGHDPVQAELMASPAGEHSAQPNLSPGRDGSFLMVWMERPPGAPSTIKFARHDGTGWSTPRVIIAGTGLVASAADIPSLIELPGGRLVAHWQQRSAAGGGSYGVRLAQSTDGGATWSAPVVPHVSHEVGENGFVSLFAASGDSAGVVWLDGRNFAGDTPSREAILATTRLAPSGALAAERVLDARVCDCCHTAFAPTPSGGILVYRDRSPTNVRDIAFIRIVDGSWSPSAPVHDDGWAIPSCPVNGPAVDAIGEAAGVAWFTNAGDSARVLVAFSGDLSRGFSPPVRVDQGDPLGRPKIVMAQPGVALVSWLERVEGNSRLLLRRVSAAGALSAPMAIATPEQTIATGFPQMVYRRGELILAWPVPAAAGAPATVRVARVTVPER